jgi:hypothetical protein
MTPLARLRWGATAALVTVAAAGGAAAAVVPSARVFMFGVIVVALLGIPSYWALSLTFRRSNGKFYGAFVGGLVGRMLGVGAGLACVWRYDRASLVAFAVAAVIGLIGLSFVEMYFIGRQNRLPI